MVKRKLKVSIDIEVLGFTTERAVEIGYLGAVCLHVMPESVKMAR